jgi:phosphopantetheinyl transferase (holo-ACP synthase)
LSGSTEEFLQGKKVHLTLSHDAGIASAMVVIEE